MFIENNNINNNNNNNKNKNNIIIIIIIINNNRKDLPRNNQTLSTQMNPQRKEDPRHLVFD